MCPGAKQKPERHELISSELNLTPAVSSVVAGFTNRNAVAVKGKTADKRESPQGQSALYSGRCDSWDSDLTLSLPSSRSTFSQTLQNICISEVVRIGSVRVSYEKPSFTYLCGAKTGSNQRCRRRGMVYFTPVIGGVSLFSRCAVIYLIHKRFSICITPSVSRNWTRRCKSKQTRWNVTRALPQKSLNCQEVWSGEAEQRPAGGGVGMTLVQPSWFLI